MLSGNLFGQNDHLEPAGYLRSSYEGDLKEYYDAIFPLLFKGLSNKPMARYTVLPSFSSEYTLSVEKDSLEVYRMILHSCSENYWYSEKRTEVGIIEKVIVIKADFAARIEELFRTAPSQIREVDAMTIGMDVVNYYFTAANPNGYLITGEKWSPQEGSTMANLVSVCQSLVDLTTDKKKDFAETEIRARKLIAELRKKE